ncbi:MAG: RNA polymerase sigma factor RpoD/SigA [Candidatus Coprovivens sp.]
MEEEEIVLLSDKELATSFVGDAYSMYMKEVFSYRLLSLEENKELARRYRAGDTKAFEMLVNHNLRLVVNMAYKYKDKLNTMSILDIIQEGNMGLMRAARDYDPDVASFSTYAYHWIKQAITRSISDKDNEIRKPVHIQALGNKYLKLIEKGKKLSDDEICKELEIGFETLETIRHSLSISSVSMNQTIDDDEKTELGDFLSNSHNDYDDILEEMSSKSLFLSLKEILSDLEYYILYVRVLSDTRLTLEQVGVEFGITRERIRQLEEKALRKAKLLMENPNKMQKLLNNLREREKGNFKHLRIEPIEPIKIIKYLYVKDSLSFEERKLLYFIYFSKYSFTHMELARAMKLNYKEFKVLYDGLINTLKSSFSNNKKFDSYRECMIKNYGTKIFTIDLNSDVKVVDYDYLRERYSSLDFDGFMELVNKAEYSITSDEIQLLTSFYHIPERKNHAVELLFRDLNLAVFGFKERTINVPKNKLWKVYQNNIKDYTDEQRLFLECYFFSKRDKSEFKSIYTESSLYYRYYYLIDRLERTYYNIYRFLDYNFDVDQYRLFKKKYGHKMSTERLELLDLFYGVNGESLSIQEIALMYNMDYIKMHDKLSDARDAAIIINAGMNKGLDIDKKRYVPYILDKSYNFTLETRLVLKLFIIDNKTYDEISNMLGLTKYRISNIITDGIRKIDAYRFGINDVFRISREELEKLFNIYEDVFLEEEKYVIRMKYLEYMENKDIASKLSIDLLEVNRCISHFNKMYFGYMIKNVDVSIEDIISEINRHPSECLLNERRKEVLSLFYGIKNGYNPNGEKLTREQIANKLNITKNMCYQAINNGINDIKGRKIGLSKVTGSYISRDELDILLDDYHLPISDKEREIICYLFELKGYPYKKIDELPEIFGDTRSSLGRRYQRAIISIYKYLNKEIEGQLSYDVDILPNLKYFSYSDRNIINKYYRDGMTVESLSKEYNVSFEKMFSILERLKVNIYDILNNPKVKKFDFDYYMKVRNNIDLPFFGDRKKSIEIFDLFFGMNDGLRMSIPEIIKKLNLDMEQTSTNRAVNNLMLAVCKYKEGIRAGNSFSYEEIKRYYMLHEDEMTYYKKQFYLRYFKRMESSCRLNGIVSGVSYVILYDLLKEKNPYIYTPDNLDRDSVIKIIRKYGSLITNATKRELMAIYEITPREFMNGKDINHVYKIFNAVDERLREKELESKTLKKD